MPPHRPHTAAHPKIDDRFSLSLLCMSAAYSRDRIQYVTNPATT